MLFGKLKSITNLPGLNRTSTNGHEGDTMVARVEEEKLKEEPVKPREALAMPEKAGEIDTLKAAESYLTEMKNEEPEAESDLLKTVTLDLGVKEDIPIESPAALPSGSKGSFDELFREDENSGSTSLERFVASLPEITCQELAEDIQKVRALIAQMNGFSERKPGKGGI
ncbi:MAG: hypothetical protein HY662_03055 [Chloroflexi bacterium]|nr:hypothetical protein [Chloroflexota bacterium]